MAGVPQTAKSTAYLSPQTQLALHFAFVGFPIKQADKQSHMLKQEPCHVRHHKNQNNTLSESVYTELCRLLVNE